MGVNRRQRWTMFLAALLALAIVLAGCSSGSGDSANSAQSGSSASVAKQDMLTASDAGGAPMEVAVSGDADQGAAIDGLLGTAGDGFNRKVVYRGTVTLEAVNFGEAVTALQNAIHQSEGYILSFQDIQSPYENGATYTIKIPAAGFMSFLDRIGKIDNTHYERQLSGTDVTEEYVDLESRMKAKQVVEARLLGFMEKATRADDLVSFSQQLANVQEEIERMKGRVRYLDQNVAYSTIELRLYQPLEPSAFKNAKREPLLMRMGDALGGSAKAVLNALQGLLVFLAGALPVLAVLAVIALPVVWIRRRLAASRSSSYLRSRAPLAQAAEGGAVSDREAGDGERAGLPEGGQADGAEDAAAGDGGKAD